MKGQDMNRKSGENDAVGGLKVAIQGYEGCFHQIVANEYFGRMVDILPCATFRDVVRAVENGEVPYGVMAIENSIAGSILPNHSLLQH